MSTHTAAVYQLDVGRWLRHGVIGGIVAGIIFAMFEMIMATVQMGSEALFMPLRMIGGIALGERALSPETPLMIAGGAGVVVHMVLSAVYGGAVALTAAVVPQLRRPLPLLAWATASGIALWLVNFYVIAPIAGWHWFPEGTDPVVQSIAHALFGLMLGLYLTRFARRH